MAQLLEFLHGGFKTFIFDPPIHHATECICHAIIQSVTIIPLRISRTVQLLLLSREINETWLIRELIPLVLHLDEQIAQLHPPARQQYNGEYTGSETGTALRGKGPTHIDVPQVQPWHP
ncbi:hypothetical protein M413DRAFT_25996 [Hebeloma cylindrosporum]|uniref:Uncharacterized protein n=1 Tax=Hebeloma cylindrosporum TaxID=76867 RepID=A0A0C3CHQ8_HEBCY|nr:hypothetical protein M413DRAFT_25996 [Hebeloma cylindrosporum h7]